MRSMWLDSLAFAAHYRPFAFLSCASCSRKDKSNSSLTFNFNAGEIFIVGDDVFHCFDRNQR